jgi:tetratricopeptide (TPR) repeat protein
MNRIYRLLNQTLLLAVIAASAALGAQVESVKLFSEQDYSRLLISLDAPFVSNVETNPAEKLIFIKFEGVGIDKLSKQSYVYDDSPFLESLSFLPLGSNQVVARVKARQDFRLKTYESAEPYRLILELSSREIKNPAPQSTPSTQDSYYHLGREQMGDGSYQAALMSFRSAIRSGDRVADSYFQAGRTRLRLGELDKALINFGHATSSESFGGEASLYQSWIHFKQKDHDKMAASWREFVRRVPDAAGRFRIASGSTEIDYRSLEDAVSLKPDEPVQETKNAAITVKAAVKEGPDAAWYFEQGVAAKQEGRLDAAAELLEKATELDPDDSETHFQLGVVYKGLDRKQASARQFQLSLGVPPQAPGQKQASLPQVDEAEKQKRFDTDLEDLEPLIDPSVNRADAATDNEQASLEQNDAAVAGSLGDGTQTPPPALATGDESGALDTIRGTAAAMINKYGISLLRHQVGLLTTLMGFIFLLTLAAEQFFRRKRNRSKSMAGPGLPLLAMAGDSSAGGQVVPMVRNKTSQAANKKQQVAEVMARELESKRRASQPAVEETADAVELQLKPVGERGMYGADIARRIKDQLSPSRAAFASEAGSPMAGPRRDDMQTRLIRQLRSKNWTIGDIAQEMSLSREEIKWALAGNSSADSTAGNGARPEVYGQVSALASRDSNRRAERIDPERMDREVDLELEINV